MINATQNTTPNTKPNSEMKPAMDNPEQKAKTEKPVSQILQTNKPNFDSITRNSNSGDTTKPKRKLNLKTVVGLVVLLLVILGSGAGFYLTQFTQQDLRQQAYVGQSCDEDSDCAAGEKCDASGSCIVPPTTGICTPGAGCEYDCSPNHPKKVKINCNLPESDCGSTRKTDICRGKQTGANCELCKKKNGGGYACPGDALENSNCDYSCACDNADQTKCYESGIGHSSGKETPGYDCKNIQRDVIHNGGHVWNCRSEDGRNWDECNPPDDTPPSGSPASACTEGQEWSPDGSLLSYDFTVSNIQGSGAFESSTIFVSFSGTKSREDLMMIDYLGTPDWDSDCSGTNWCGYAIHRQSSVSGNSFKWVWRGNDASVKVGSNNRSLKDISSHALAVLDRPYRLPIAVNLKMGGIQNDSIGSFKIDIFPDACDKPEIPKLACEDVAVLDTDGNEVTDGFYVGQALALRCRSTKPDETLHHYEFMVSLDGKVIVSKDSDINIDPTGTTAISQPFNIESTGVYEAQCTVCTSATECNPFVSISTPPTIPTGAN